MGFNYISVLRNNSADLPDKIKLDNSSKKYAYNNEYNMKIQQYEDKKLSNFVINTNLNLEELKKSLNILKHGVDKMNQVISYYNIDRKSYKCWKKVFFFGIETSISNVKIMFEQINKSNKEDNLRFRINLFSQLLTNNDEDLYDNNIKNNYIPQIYRKRFHEAVKAKSSDCSYCKLELGKRLKSNIYCVDSKKPLHPQCFVFVAFHKKYVYNKI